MNPRSTRWTRDDERGAVLIEFALVLPLLLLLVVGMFDLGFAFQRYQAVTNAAREGARMAVLPGYTTDDIRSRVTEYLRASGVPLVPAPTIDVDLISVPAPGGGALFAVMRVQVQVIHTFTLLGPIAALVGGSFGTVPLVSESVMRTEVSTGGS
jgi:hypothetical protein